MRQATLKIKNYTATAVSVASSGGFRGRALTTLLWLFCMLGVSYAFLLGSMVFNIVERRALELQASALDAEVKNLELEYLSALKRVDFELAYSLGFRETEKSFTARPALVRTDMEVKRNEI